MLSQRPRYVGSYLRRVLDFCLQPPFDVDITELDLLFIIDWNSCSRYGPVKLRKAHLKVFYHAFRRRLIFSLDYTVGEQNIRHRVGEIWVQ